MLNTLRKKYMVVGSALILVFLGFLFLASGILRNQMVEKWNRKRMWGIAKEAEALLRERDLEEVKAELDTLAFENNVSIAVTDWDYNLLASTRIREALRGALRHASMETIAENQEKLKEEGWLFYSAFDDDHRTSFTQISLVEDVGYMIMRKSIKGFNSSVFVMQQCFIIAAAITMVIGFFIMLWLSGRMAEPIKEISRITGRIARLDFEEKVRVRSKDELGQLGESVNEMSDQLEKAVTSLQKDVENRKTLVRNMAHELKTPAAVIMGYAENMPYIAKKNVEKLEKYCQVIIKECERMDVLICQMLEASACETGQRPLRTTGFLAADFLDSLKRGYEDEFPGHEGSLLLVNQMEEVIFGDLEFLKRAVYNLIKNAVRYGRKDGCIQVRIWQEEGRVYFCVHNQGSQIPREEQEKIWNVFYKLDAARKRDENSFGVGLSIVKQTAQNHGGDVFVNNTEDGVELGFYILKKNG